MGIWRERKATKIEVLEFITEREIVSIHDLVEYFGYRYATANWRLWRLQKEGLVSKLGAVRGKWVLTEKGYSRLAYYGRLS